MHGSLITSICESRMTLRCVTALRARTGMHPARTRSRNQTGKGLPKNDDGRMVDAEDGRMIGAQHGKMVGVQDGRVDDGRIVVVEDGRGDKGRIVVVEDGRGDVERRKYCSMSQFGVE